MIALTRRLRLGDATIAPCDGGRGEWPVAGGGSAQAAEGEDGVEAALAVGDQIVELGLERRVGEYAGDAVGDVADADERSGGRRRRCVGGVDHLLDGGDAVDREQDDGGDADRERS